MLKPDFAEALVNLGIAIKNVKFNSSNPKLYPPLTQLLTAGNFTHPNDVAGSILSLIKFLIFDKIPQIITFGFETYASFFRLPMKGFLDSYVL